MNGINRKTVVSFTETAMFSPRFRYPFFEKTINKTKKTLVLDQKNGKQHLPTNLSRLRQSQRRYSPTQNAADVRENTLKELTFFIMRIKAYRSFSFDIFRHNGPFFHFLYYT